MKYWLIIYDRPQDCFLKGKDELTVPNGAGGFGCGGLRLWHESYPFRLVEIRLKGFLHNEVAKVIMYLHKQYMRKTGRDNQLCVSHLSSYFLEFISPLKTHPRA